MITPEGEGLYDVTCLDCKKSKSYFTPQGVSFFKLDHEGHQVRVDVPLPTKVEENQSQVKKPPKRRSETTKVSVENLVVDVVKEDMGRIIKVYGISEGQELFTKSFQMSELDRLNAFLEGGAFTVEASSESYVWTPDKVDLSPDVAKQLDSPAEQAELPTPEVPRILVPASGEDKFQSHHRENLQSPKNECASSIMVSPNAPFNHVPTEPLQDETGEMDGLRVEKVLKEYDRGLGTPYAVGSIVDDLLSIQSRTGTIMGSLIERVVGLGYSFIAVEVVKGRLSAWFKKDGASKQPSAPSV